MLKKALKLTKFDFLSLVPSDEVAAINFMVFESGMGAVICKGVKQKKKRDAEINYSATIISSGEKIASKLVSGFPPGSNQNLNWYFSKNDLLFNGLLGESQQKGFTKVVAGHYKVNSGLVEGLEMSAFDNARLNSISKLA